MLETDGADEASAKIARLVETSVDPALTVDPRRTAAALASTLGLRPLADPLESLDPRELYRELVEAWRALLASFARSFPVVAVVEDLHWADPTMLDVLDELAERLDGPILFLCTARPDLLRSRPDWGGGRRNFSSLPLDPLSDDESARLASLLPGVDELPDRVRRLILERSERQPVLPRGDRPPPDQRGSARPGGRAVAVLGRHRPGRDPGQRPGRHPRAARPARPGGAPGRSARGGGGASVLGRRAGAPRARRRSRRCASNAPPPRVRARAALVLDPGPEGVRLQARPHPRRRLREPAAGGAGAARTRRPARGSRRRAASGRTSWRSCSRHHYDAAFSLLRDDGFGGTPAPICSPPRPTRIAASRSSRAIGSRAARSSSPRASAERVESLEALGDLHYLAFLGDAAWRTYGEALAELSDGDPAFARLAGKATLFSTRFLGTMHELPEVEAVRRIVERGLLAAPGPGRERTLLLVNRGFLLSQREGRRDEVDRRRRPRGGRPPRRSSAMPTCSRRRSISMQTHEENERPLRRGLPHRPAAHSSSSPA